MSWCVVVLLIGVREEFVLVLFIVFVVFGCFFSVLFDIFVVVIEVYCWKCVCLSVSGIEVDGCDVWKWVVS